MKRMGVLLIVTLILLLSGGAVVFADGISVTINGQPLAFDQPPVIIDGRTVVPVAQIFRSLGASVEWDGETRTVYGSRDNDIIVLQIDNRFPTVNGKEIELDVPATIVNGRTMVPTKFVAESLGAVVNWDPETRTVVIASVESETEADTTGNNEPFKITKVEADISLYGAHVFNEGLLPIWENTGIGESGWMETRDAYLNKYGEIVNIGQFDGDDVQKFSFSEGLAPIFKWGEGLGYMNKKGEMVIQMEFEPLFSMGTILAGRFVDGKAPVLESVIFAPGSNAVAGSRWYYIDTNGEPVDGVIYESINQDHFVSDHGGYRGETYSEKMINVFGEEIYANFSEGLALISINDGPNKGIYIIEEE